MLAAEDVQRQVAIAVVVAVEEPARWMTVNRIVGGIEVQDELFRRRGVESQEGFHEPGRELVLPSPDLLITALGVGLGRSQLQAIQRALAGQWLAPVAWVQPLVACHIAFTDQRRQQGIGPQLVVIVQVFIAQGQGEHPLLDQLLDRVFDQIRIAEIIKTASQVREQTGLGLHLPQQQAACIRSNRPTIEPGRDFAVSQGLEIERSSATLCRHRAASLLWAKLSFAKTTYATSRPPVLYAL